MALPLALFPLPCSRATATGYLTTLDFSCDPARPTGQRCISSVALQKGNYALWASGFVNVSAAQARKPIPFTLLTSGRARVTVAGTQIVAPGGEPS